MIVLAGPETHWRPRSLLDQLEEVVGQRHRLDDALVGLVVPVAGDELDRPPAEADHGRDALRRDSLQAAQMLEGDMEMCTHNLPGLGSHVGRDFLSRNIYGARVSLLVGFAATAVTVLVATAVGGLSGFVGGQLDGLTCGCGDRRWRCPGRRVAAGKDETGPGMD